jgi:hypothetical protein
MTAAGELLNLPVAIPARNPVAAYHLPPRQGAVRYNRPQAQRVYPLPHRKPSEAFRYDADGYTRVTPEKGGIIDLFA